MTISPLIPYLPAALSFFIYGLVTSGLFRYGRRGGRGCLPALIFWYGFAILCVFLAALVSVQETTRQVSFLLGLLIPFVRSMWESEAVQAPIHFVRATIDLIQHTAWQIGRLWQAWQDRKERTQTGTQKAGQQSNRTHGQQSQQRHGHQSQGNHHNTHQHTQDQARDRERERHQEQQQREAEARARREQAERERQERQNANKPPPDTGDAPRDPEAILGLKKPWTEEDLRTAYKREAGRTHPDKWIGKPQAIRQMMEAEYKAIQEAYKILQNRKP